MGTLTKTTRAIIGLFTGNGSSSGSGSAPPPIPQIKPVTTLQKYLEKAYKDVLVANKLGAQPADDSEANLHVPISLFAHAKTGTQHQYAGIHDDEIHFSASLLKVAAMFAAYSLRSEARLLAATGGFANPNAFFTALAGKFKSTDAVQAIQNKGVGLNPKYQDILQITSFGGGTPQIDFKPDFFVPIPVDHPLFVQYQTVHQHEVDLGHIKSDEENAATLAALSKVSHMYRMIVPSNNASAGECIRRLGYAYINVKLMNAGLYDSKSTPPKGVWLAADYAGGPRVEIDSVNDGKSAQATSARQMARLFSLIDVGQLITARADGNDDNADMKALLHEAQGVDSSWISMDGNTTKIDYEGVKVGLANLKPNTPPKGPDVYSEGVLMTWNSDADKLTSMNLNGQLVVCWQNLRVSAYGTGVPAIGGVIETAFSNFLKQTAI
jgi:hypothetical protein